MLLSVMKTLFNKLGKTGAIVATIIGILTGLIALNEEWCNFKQKEISGEWKIKCNIENSSYKAYIGKSCGFKIFFNQQEKNLKGVGEMCWVNDDEIPFSEHIKIDLEGKINKDDVEITYTQYGQKRTTSGTMKLKLISELEMEGVFSGTAANSDGTVKAIKKK